MRTRDVKLTSNRSDEWKQRFARALNVLINISVDTCVRDASSTE